MRFVLPTVMAFIGAAGGIGAGLYLKPADAVLGVAPQSGDHAQPVAEAQGEQAVSEPANTVGEPAAATSASKPHSGRTGATEFTKLNNQFVIPVLKEGRVRSMVVMSLSLETPNGGRERVFAQEPRIRDTFLQVLFDHANIGGFDGEFTNGASMGVLRGELVRASKTILGPDIIDVLVTDIARQDLG